MYCRCYLTNRGNLSDTRSHLSKVELIELKQSLITGVRSLIQEKPGSEPKHDSLLILINGRAISMDSHFKERSPIETDSPLFPNNKSWELSNNPKDIEDIFWMYIIFGYIRGLHCRGHLTNSQ